MRIRVWTAFASNNSGSYVIVGRFPSAELAAEVAGELREVVGAHHAWKTAEDSPRPPDGPSPLAVYATALGLTHVDEADRDDWPQYSRQGAPGVWAIGHQVFVYCDYTVTLPRAFGHVFYARGGRVDTELDHAHHPIVATFEIYFPWQTRKIEAVPGDVQRIVDALCADDGALVLHRVPCQAPGWRGATAETAAVFGEGDLVVAAVFEDLAAGFAGVQAAAAAVGALVRVRVAEAHGERGADALAHLRPCVPPTTRPLVDVVLEAIGPARTGLAKHLAAVGVVNAQVRMQTLPVVVLEAVSGAQAEAARAALRAEGATVRIQPSRVTV